MLRIEVTHTLPVSVAEAFAYITDMKNWPEYWPNFIRIENPSAARWSNPGDRATVVIELLNRERALNMELEAFQRTHESRTLAGNEGYPMFAMNATLRPRAMAASTGSRRIRTANGFCGSLR